MGLNFEHGKETFWNFSCGKKCDSWKVQIAKQVGKEVGWRRERSGGEGKGECVSQLKKDGKDVNFKPQCVMEIYFMSISLKITS